MANPRQRKKSRAGNPGKVTGHALRRLHAKQVKVPALRGPEVLREKWDKKLTVRQNYEALGLLSSIPLPASANATSSSSKSKSTSAPVEPTIVGFGRIVRDRDGNVIDVILPDEEKEEVVEEEEEEEEEVVPEGGRKRVSKGKGREVVAKTDVAKTLESLSSLSAPIKRHSSTSEHTWLLQLLSSHGRDFTSMARDKKLNVWQKTEGDLKRMVRKAGGWEVLEKEMKKETGGMEVD